MIIYCDKFDKTYSTFEFSPLFMYFKMSNVKISSSRILSVYQPNIFCQAQPKPQLNWAEWLYFQLIQPPPPRSLNLVSKFEQSR